MTRHLSTLLAGSGLWVIASVAPAYAQTAQPAPASSSANAGTQAQEANQAAKKGDEEETIIVTARRRAENVQDVPQTVQAVPGETLAKLNLYQFEDLAKVVSGLSLSRAGNVVTLRGVSFNPVAQTNPTTSFYMNEAPVQSTFIFQSAFDVGQIEVLRGPQGTLRGQSAPSGAFTLTTRRPDLNEWGGFATATATTREGRTFQGAVNIPIIADKLALRIAGILDHNDNGGVKSVNSTTDPSFNSNAFRATLRFEPTDNLSAVLMYQYLYTKTLGFGGGAIFGNGNPGRSGSASGYNLPITVPAGINGPVIPQGERLAVAENADLSKARQQLGTAQVDYRIAGQKLSYVGGWSHNESPLPTTFGDIANMVPHGDWRGRATVSHLTRWTHELRLSSDQRLFGFLDYVVGVFHEKETITNAVGNGLSFTAGAFGSPLGAPMVVSPNLRFSTETRADIHSVVKETSFFGNATIHLGKNTELSGGIRFIHGEKNGLRVNSQTASFTASRTIASQAACLTAGGQWQATYANVCDVPAAGIVTATIPDVWSKKPVVWSASLSHHFTPGLMVYGSAGTSWRPGPTQGALINGANDPLLASLVQLPDEKSKSFEVGFKSSWLDDRLTFNAAYYHQTFKNLVFSVFGAIPYLVDTGVPGVPRTVQFQFLLNTPVDAKIDGVDLEAGYRTRRLNLNAGFSWANGKFANAVIPCFNPALTTVAQFQAAGVFIAMCPTSGRSNATPKWNARLRAEYTHPISSNVEGFVSGLFTYTPKNTQQAGSTFIQPHVALLNLYIGARSPKTGWEVQVFAKNVLDHDKITALGTTDITDTPNVSGIFGSSGYRTIGYADRREFGVTLRYAIGSR